MTSPTNHAAPLSEEEMEEKRNRTPPITVSRRQIGFCLPYSEVKAIYQTYRRRGRTVAHYKYGGDWFEDVRRYVERDIDSLERSFLLAALRGNGLEQDARLYSLLSYVPDGTLCGELQAKAEEFKTLRAEVERLTAEIKEPRCVECDSVLADNWCATCAAKTGVEIRQQQAKDLKAELEAVHAKALQYLRDGADEHDEVLSLRQSLSLHHKALLSINQQFLGINEFDDSYIPRIEQFVCEEIAKLRSSLEAERARAADALKILNWVVVACANSDLAELKYIRKNIVDSRVWREEGGK